MIGNYKKYVFDVCSSLYYNKKLICIPKLQNKRFDITLNYETKNFGLKVLDTIDHGMISFPINYDGYTGKWRVSYPCSFNNNSVLLIESGLNRQDLIPKSLQTYRFDTVGRVFSICNEIKINCDNYFLPTLFRNNEDYYVQLRNFGLYQTGFDVMDLNLPGFECKSSMTFVPFIIGKKQLGIMCNIIPFKNNTLECSKYSLDMSHIYKIPNKLYVGL